MKYFKNKIQVQAWYQFCIDAYTKFRRSFSFAMPNQVKDQL